MVKTIVAYFFDSYAFFEIIEGNSNYKKYTRDIAIVTTKLNLMELHYGLLVKYGKYEADKYFDELINFAVDISDDIIKMANDFRLSMKGRKLSYVDCIGYIIARLRNIKFLTGDNQFENLDNVEFIK